MFLFSVKDQAWKLNSVYVMMKVHGATKLHFCFSLNTLPAASQKFCWLFLAVDAHWADGLRQLLTVTSATSGLFPGPWCPVQSSASKSFGLDYFPLCALPSVSLYWNSNANSMHFVQFCKIPQDVVIGMAFDCLGRSGISVDLVILCALPSAGCEWRCWIKPVSANTHCCLLSTIKTLSFASQPLTYSQFKNELFLQILGLVCLLITKKKTKSKDSEELLKWVSYFYSPCIFLIQNRPPQIYSGISDCRRSDPEDQEDPLLPWVTLQ